MAPESSLPETAASFLLLIPAFLPLLFFVLRLLQLNSSTPKSALTAYIVVSVLGPLAALATSLGITARTMKDRDRSLHIAQNVLQSIVELGNRIAILYLITPRSALVVSSRVSLSSKDLYRHNTLFAFFIFAALLISLIWASLPAYALPISVPPAFGLLIALFPIPLIVHLALATQSTRVRRIWAFIALLQIFSALAHVLRIPQETGYKLPCAIFTVLWGGGIITLFYALSFTPLSPPPQPFRLPKFSSLSSEPSSPSQVHYHTPQRPFSGVIISEDFTTLRDPFASPPPVSPVSPGTPIPPAPSPSPSTYPRIILSPPPTPAHKPCKPPVPKARETKPQRRSVTKKTGISKRVSSQSLMQPLSPDEPRDASYGSEDALFLNDEALLSQILLRALTLDVAPAPAQEDCSTCSSSITTIRTTRDESGRRYALEEIRPSSPGPAGVVEDDEESSACRDSRYGGTDKETEKQNIPIVVVTREGSEDVETQAIKEMGAVPAWWIRG